MKLLLCIGRMTLIWGNILNLNVDCVRKLGLFGYAVPLKNQLNGFDVYMQNQKDIAKGYANYLKITFGYACAVFHGCHMNSGI